MSAVGSPFARSRAIFAAIAALMGSGASRMHAVELAGGASYKSRGKGLGKVTRAHAGTVAQAKRAAVKARNRAKHRSACRG